MSPQVGKRFCGFTLVEILIVVVILAILAAIVLPSFTNAAESARETATRSLLKSVRIQLELYKSQHNDDWPLLSQLWDNLMQPTDTDGNIDPAGERGPYLRKEPHNQFNKSQTVVAPGAATASDGWEYDEATGEFTAVGFDEVTGIYTPP